MKSVQIALLLALLVPLASTVDARQSQSSSYKSGFSSQKSSPTRSGSSFGSFGGRSSAPPARAPALSSAGRGGGFGSFGSGASSTPERKDSAARSSGSGSFGSFGNAMPSAPQQSDSALSRGLNKSASEANAVRTLEARRRAEQDAMNETARPVPSGPLPQRDDAYAGGADHYRGVPSPVVIQQNNGNGGIANVITGFLLARATAPSHASRNGYPAQAGQPATNSADAAGGSFFMTMLRTFAWLLIVSVIGWTMYFVWKFLRRGKAPSQANYSFER